MCYTMHIWYMLEMLCVTASVLEWHSGGGSVFDTTPPHRRHRLLVCQTHQPLFGASFRKYVSQSVGDLASKALWSVSLGESGVCGVGGQQRCPLRRMLASRQAALSVELGAGV